MFRVKGVFSEPVYRVTVKQFAKLFCVDLFNLLYFMRRAEAVKEVKEWDPAFNSREVCDTREVHYLLDTAGSQHRKTGLAYSVYIRMIAKNGKSLCRKSPCSNMKNRRQQFARNFVHIGDHKQKPL